MKTNRLLLDTHIFIWLMFATKPLKAKSILDTALKQGSLFLSTISIWEIGLLASKQRVHFELPCHQWVEEALSKSGILTLTLSQDAALEASFLPSAFHEDPADRLLVATARTENLTLVTRDSKILAYGQQGHVDVLES